MYIPLGIKTDYSLLQSLIKLEDLVLYAKNNNKSVLGILDDNLCSSHMFYKKCVENNIKPIIGLDITIDNYRLFLYPTNMDGLSNLFKLLEFKIDNVLTIGSLKDYRDNVICVLPHESYSIYETISKIFNKVYLSFKNDNESLEAKVICDNTVYINDIYALDVNSSKYVNYLHMIESGKSLGEVVLENYEGNILREEKYDTLEFTNNIDIKFDTSKRYIPVYDDNKNSREYLYSLATKGLDKRLKGNVTKEYKDRLDYELKVISDMGFNDYFLIVFDYVRYALKNNIFVGAGRGSAAGSLVAYSLGITWVDPLKYDLLFERFLNPDRVTMPDIDIDFEYERRDEVVSYVKDKYGEKCVAKIIAYGTMTTKDVLRTVAKINNVDDVTLKSLFRIIDRDKTLKENMSDELKALLNRNSRLSKVYNESFYLEGLKKHITTHAAGVVISSTNLTNVLPVVKSGNELLTGYDKDELEELGILKMDFLSIRNLTIMSDTIKNIEKEIGRKININTIPLDDKKVYELFSKGDTVGIFQFEKEGMKSFLRRLKPTSFEDLVMAIAMYRPGPISNIGEYCDRKNKNLKYNLASPLLKPILDSTYGILIYQEQVMEILRVLGDFSYAEADIVRRGISKKKFDIINSTKDKFIKSALNKGCSRDEANQIYELILKFADFGFNKSHSVAYSMIAYQMAYLKVHFKEDFYINLLNNNIGGEDKTKEYIEEAKKQGISILKPDVNKSDKYYVREDKSIRLPLRVIKGVGTVSSDAIIKKREDGFKDFFDFISRCYGSNVNKKVLECLIDGGAFDSFGVNRATLNKNLNSVIKYGELVNELGSEFVSPPVMEEEMEESDIILMNKELELFGFYVSTHPASKYPNLFKQINIEKYFDKRIETVVLVESIRKIKTKTNKDMAFLTGSDETTSSEFTVFDNCFSSLDSINKGDLVKILGRVEKRLDKYSIVVNKIEKI